MAIGDLKIVDFTYCNTCKHKDLPETAEPCCECLSETARIDSHKPVSWVDKNK